MFINELGNVGIGTITPTTPLEVVGFGSLISARNTGTGNNYTAMRLGNDTGYGCYWFLNSSGRSADGGVSTATLRNDLGSLRLQSNGGTGIIVASSTGNVGIGTANPLCQLYNFSANTSGWAGWAYFGNGTSGVVAGAYNNLAYLGGHSGALNAWTDLYLAPGGNVAVGGSTAPPYKLTVTGAISASGAVYTNDWFRCNSSISGLYWENLGYGLTSADCFNGRSNPTTMGNVQCYGTPKGSIFGYNVPFNPPTGTTYGGICFASTSDGNTAGICHQWGNALTNKSFVVKIDFNEVNAVYLGTGSVRISQDWDRILGYANGYNTASGYMYYNQGNVLGTASDSRIKKDFLPITEDVSITFIKALKPTSFCLKESVYDVIEESGVKPAVCACRQDGWIAQDVLEACNLSGASKSVVNKWYDYEQELLKPEEERKTLLGVSDRPILSHTVNVVKALLDKVVVLTQRNEVLEAWARQQEKGINDYKKDTSQKIEKLASLITQLMGK